MKTISIEGFNNADVFKICGKLIQYDLAFGKGGFKNKEWDRNPMSKKGFK